MQDAPYRLLPIRAGKGIAHTLVDPEDYDELAKFDWQLTQNGYVARFGREPGDSTYMHRQLLGLVRGDGIEGDHKNRDRLDNRRSNLRQATHADNGRNVPSQDGSSRYRGVRWYGSRSRWRAEARFDRRNHHLGYFHDEGEAARAVNTFWVERGYEAPNRV